MPGADVIDAADFRAAYGNNIVKRFARDLRAPISTARRMIYEGVWPSRRREAALVLLQQIDRELADLTLVKAKIGRIVEEYEHDADRRESNKGNGAMAATPRNTNDRLGGIPVQDRRANRPK